jgi:hypothetical protein
MDEKQKSTLKNLGEHALHGAEDVVDVAGHGIGGAVKGVADGVENVSSSSEDRKEEK